MIFNFEHEAGIRSLIHKTIHHNRLYEEDLLQDAREYVLLRMRKFDPVHGTQPITYYGKHLRGRICAINYRRIVRIPRTHATWKFGCRWNRFTRAAFHDGDVSPENIQRIAAEQGAPVEIEKVPTLLRTFNYFEFPDIEWSESHGAPIEAEPHRTAEEIAYHQEIQAKMDDYEASLGGLRLCIYQQRMKDGELMTFKEIAEQFKISRQRVQRVERGMMKNMKNLFAEFLP